MEKFNQERFDELMKEYEGGKDPEAILLGNLAEAVVSDPKILNQQDSLSEKIRSLLIELRDSSLWRSSLKKIKGTITNLDPKKSPARKRALEILDEIWKDERPNPLQRDLFFIQQASAFKNLSSIIKQMGTSEKPDEKKETRIETRVDVQKKIIDGDDEFQRKLFGIEDTFTNLLRESGGKITPEIEKKRIEYINQFNNLLRQANIKEWDQTHVDIVLGAYYLLLNGYENKETGFEVQKTIVDTGLNTGIILQRPNLKINDYVNLITMISSIGYRNNELHFSPKGREITEAIEELLNLFFIAVKELFQPLQEIESKDKLPPSFDQEMISEMVSSLSKMKFKADLEAECLIYNFNKVMSEILVFIMNFKDEMFSDYDVLIPLYDNLSTMNFHKGRAFEIGVPERWRRFEKWFYEKQNEYMEKIEMEIAKEKFNETGVGQAWNSFELAFIEDCHQDIVNQIERDKGKKYREEESDKCFENYIQIDGTAAELIEKINAKDFRVHPNVFTLNEDGSVKCLSISPSRNNIPPVVDVIISSNTGRLYVYNEKSKSMLRQIGLI